MKYLYLIITILLFTSCEDIIELPLEEGPKRLVIDANINWEKGTSGRDQAIKLTETAGFYETTVPLVHGATVIIKNSIGTEFPFLEEGMSGIYKTSSFTSSVNETYTLTVDYNGETFSAKETLMPVADIDSIGQSVDNAFGAELVKVEFFFQEPIDEENYYISQFNLSYEDSSLDGYSYRTQNDRFTNGEFTSVVELDGELAPGDFVTLYFYGASKTYFNYMSLLLEQIESDGPFGTPPASVKGNCTNNTNPENKPLGYFRLSQMVEKSYEITVF